MRRCRFLPLALSLAVASLSAGQARADDRALEVERDAYVARRRSLMIGLGAWSAVSLASGVVLLATDPVSGPPDPSRRAFERSLGAINIAYAVVNGVIAAGVLASLPGKRETLVSEREIHFQDAVSSKVFTFNVGLDMIHLLTGALLWQHGPNATSRGTGAGIATQAGVLLAFDTLGSIVLRP